MGVDFLFINLCTNGGHHVNLRDCSRVRTCGCPPSPSRRQDKLRAGPRRCEQQGLPLITDRTPVTVTWGLKNKEEKGEKNDLSKK